MENRCVEKHLIMTREGVSSYGFSSDDAELVAIGFFLTDDCRGEHGFNRYYRWALDPLSDETGGNITTVKKIGNKVELTWDVDETEETRAVLSVEEFIRMLEMWKKTTALYPAAVRITLADGKVTLEALDTAAPQ